MPSGGGKDNRPEPRASTSYRRSPSSRDEIAADGVRQECGYAPRASGRGFGGVDSMAPAYPCVVDARPLQQTWNSRSGPAHMDGTDRDKGVERSDGGTGVLERTRSAQAPTLPPFKVMLHNDHVHDMLYVVRSLVELTPLNADRASEVMLRAH